MSDEYKQGNHRGSEMQDLPLWRPYNFTVPFLREFVQQATYEFIRGFAEVSNEIDWVAVQILYRYHKRGSKRNILYTSNAIERFRAFLSRESKRVLIIPLPIRDESDVHVTTVLVILYKNQSLVEFYHPKREFYRSRIFRSFQTAFQSFFQGIVSKNFNFFLDGDPPRPAHLLEDFLEMYPQIFSRLYLVPEFNSVEYLWTLFAMVHVRFDVKEPFGTNEIFAIIDWLPDVLTPELHIELYGAFNVFLEQYAGFLWGRLPQKCQTDIAVGLGVESEPEEHVAARIQDTESMLLDVMEHAGLSGKQMENLLKLVDRPAPVERIRAFLSTHRVRPDDVERLVLLYEELRKDRLILEKRELEDTARRVIVSFQSGRPINEKVLRRLVLPVITLIQNQIFIDLNCVDVIPSESAYDLKTIEALVVETNKLDTDLLFQLQQ